jgi:hypothetical protein
MKKTWYVAGIVVLAVLAAAWYFRAGKMYLRTSPGSQPSQDMSAKTNPMTFFLTGANPGKGADLGGLAGADNYCQTLATAAGAGSRTWRAYLSTQGAEAVNARDRIGKGPWQNFQGVVIANSIDELHGANNLNKQTALTEKGQIANGRGDTPNTHDILTGSGMDGRTIAGEADTTCGNWTKSGEGSAMLGHHDRVGTSDTEAARSWNSSHASRGCGLEALASTGGGGLFYCFAVTQ